MESVLFSLVKAPHYIVLDTNVVLEQIDLLESDGLKNIIVLHTGQLRTVPWAMVGMQISEPDTRLFVWIRILLITY
jgi:hypothetical protein